MARDKVCVVIGAGDATGGAIARRFAREGFAAVVTRRNADSGWPVANITSMTIKAATNPSPVGETFAQIICPLDSPPSVAPSATIRAIT